MEPYTDKSKRRLRNQTSPLIGTTASVLLGPNEKRYGIIVTCPSISRISISFQGDAVLDQGITLFPSQQPFIILDDHVGDAIREQVSAISNGAAQNISVIDLMYK